MRASARRYSMAGEAVVQKSASDSGKSNNVVSSSVSSETRVEPISPVTVSMRSSSGGC
jgi:hypothetical protein